MAQQTSTAHRNVRMQKAEIPARIILSREEANGRRSDAYTNVQAIAFSIMCFSIPGLTASFWEFCGEGFGELCQLYSLILLFVLIGGLGYGCKIPERWAPGRFDFIGGYPIACPDFSSALAVHRLQPSADGLCLSSAP